jgi:hypothetical protein
LKKKTNFDNNDKKTNENPQEDESQIPDAIPDDEKTEKKVKGRKYSVDAKSTANGFAQ